MKPSIMRRIRRRAAHDTTVKKENKQEQHFFSVPASEHFFQPAVQVQRKCEKCEEEEKNVQRFAEKKEDEKLQKKEEDKKDEKLMKKDDKKEEDKKLQKKEAGGTGAAPVTSSYINSLNGRGTVLPPHAQQFFSSRMGYDFSNVKVHTDKAAADSAREVNAKAYTVGNNIVFSEGRYDTDSAEGKKLMAHELVHVMQQQEEQQVSRKGEEEEAEQECTAGSVDLEGETNATYKKGAGVANKEVTKKSKGCDGCEDDACVSITGTLVVPYSVATKVTLPSVPTDLTPCQQDRVRAAINGPLNTHEQKHVAAFNTFNGNASLPINYHGCEDGYVTYQEGLAEAEYERRKTIADAKSAALDPFSVPVDLCCKDKPQK